MVKYNICRQVGRGIGCWVSAAIGPGSQQDIGRGNMQAVQLRALKAFPQTVVSSGQGPWPGLVWSGFDRMGEEEDTW